MRTFLEDLLGFLPDVVIQVLSVFFPIIKWAIAVVMITVGAGLCLLFLFLPLGASGGFSRDTSRPFWQDFGAWLGLTLLGLLLWWGFLAGVILFGAWLGGTWS